MTSPPGPLLAQYDNMLACIRCGLCLSVCPTYRETSAEEESPRGRIAMARAFTEGHLSLTPDILAHEESCVQCEACTAICPTGVRMGELERAFREVAEQGRVRPVRERLLRRLAFRWLLADMGRFRLACTMLGLYQRSGLERLARARGLLDLLGLRHAHDLLPPLSQGFLVPRGQVWRPQGSPRWRVALFAGCVMSTAYASITEATVRLLLATGCEVVLPPGQGCCGALHAHSGDLSGARLLAQGNLAAFGPEGVDAVVVNAAGCGAMLKGYEGLLGPQAQAFSHKVKDIVEWLDQVGLPQPLAELPLAVTYQDPCHHAHAQGIHQAPRRLLRAIPGLRLVEMEESSLCCGSAGIYNLTHPQMAQGLLQRKLRHAVVTGSQLIVTANPGCLLQLQAGIREQGLPLRAVHIVELVDEAYRQGAAYGNIREPSLSEVTIRETGLRRFD